MPAGSAGTISSEARRSSRVSNVYSLNWPPPFSRKASVSCQEKPIWPLSMVLSANCGRRRISEPDLALPLMKAHCDGSLTSKPLVITGRRSSPR